MASNIDPQVDGARIWEQLRQEKAAGGYPWTHLTHNDDDEVWIDPLLLPSDIGRETLRRKDGRIPDEWFHLPQGVQAPTVEELLREDSDQEEDLGEITEGDLPKAQTTDVGEKSSREDDQLSGRKTPSGRRTPICGKHRHRRKSSNGSSPAPASRSHHQSSSSLRTEHPTEHSQPEISDRTNSQREHPTDQGQPTPDQSTTPLQVDSGGYEPVGTIVPPTRSPNSKLPNLPTEEDPDYSSTTGCFPIRKSRSSSKDKTTKKSSKTSRHRSLSRASGCSEHNYETPKLLQKFRKNSTKSPCKPEGIKTDLEDGYEPVGGQVLSMESWIAEKEREFNNFSLDKGVRNIEGGIEGAPHEVIVTESETGKIIFKETLSQENLDTLDKDDISHNLQRNSSVASRSSVRLESSAISKEEPKAKSKEIKKKEKYIKEEQAKEKKIKEKEERRLKYNDDKLRKQQEKEAKLTKENAEKEQKRRELEDKKLIEKMLREEQKNEQQIKENESKEKNRIEQEEKRIEKKLTEEKTRKEKEEKEAKRRENKEKRLMEREEEKERKLLAKLEKTRQERELKEVDMEKEEPSILIESTRPEAEAIQLAGQSQRDPPEEPQGASATKTPGQQEDTSTGDNSMALSPRSPGDEGAKYVSVVTNEEFSAFHRNGYHDEEEIDFTPQNGYMEPEEMEWEEEEDTNIRKSGASKLNMMDKLTAAGTAIKNARLPSAGEIKEGYLNSAFHKSLHQPLMVKAKVEKVDVQKARQALTQEKSPVQLGNIDSLSDIPLPTIRKGKEDKEDKEEGPGLTLPRNLEELGQAAYNTLPRSMREQNIVTAVKENLDPEELERCRELTRTKTPAELAQIHSLSEIPVPDKIKNLFEKKENSDKKEPKKRRHSDSEPEVSEPFSIYSTLPRSMRETKLITNIKVKTDDETLRARQALVESKTPAELSTITSISDLPVPSKLTKIMNRAPSAPESKLDLEGRSSSKGLSKMNLTDMFTTMPKSLTMELVVSTKDQDQDLVEQRKKLIEEKTPMELGNIGSLAELPIPAPIQRLYNKATEEAPEKPKRKNLEEKRKRNLTTGTLLSPDFLPESWRETKLLVRSKEEEVDEDQLRARQLLIETKKPGELGQIHGLSDLPVPTKIQTLMRSKKRTLKSTEEKEMSKKVSKSALSLPTMASFTLPQSLKSELLVKSKIEDPEKAVKNRELTKTKSVSELSQMKNISDFPIPDGIENFFKQNPVKSKKTDDEGTELGSDRPTSPQSFKESIYESLPRSLVEQQLLVKSKVEHDEEKVKERQEITRTKSPTELARMSSFSDFPIPAPVENMLKKKSPQDIESPVAPPRKWRKEDIYDSLPSSLTMELAVGSKVSQLDPEEVERLRSQTPAQLSEIHSLSDIPVPACLENFVTRRGQETEPDTETIPDEDEAEKVPFSLYSTLAPLKETKLMVKTVTEDPEVQAVRAEVVKSKSVGELSQITSLSDIPIPAPIENLIRNSKTLAPAERKKKFKEKMKSQSTQSLHQSLYSTLPRALKQDLLVKQRLEDPDILAERRAVVASKSVSELSQITSFSDLPIPTTLQRAFHKSMERLSGLGTPKQDNDDIRPTDVSPVTLPRNTKELQEAVYSRLPTSLTQPVVVRSKVEDPDILLERQQLQQTKSIHELSKIRNLNEVPVPGNLVKLPDVPLPKMKDILKYIAPTRSSLSPKSARTDTYHSYEAAPEVETVDSTPLTEDKVFLSESCLESPMMSITSEQELGYEEVATKQHLPEITPEEDMEMPSPSPAPTPTPATVEVEVEKDEEEEEEEDQFSLAEQIRGTPERSMRKTKKKNRRSHEVAEDLESSSPLPGDQVEVPPPLPPKRVTPSPAKKEMELEHQQSVEEEIEAVPVKGILTLEADVEGNIQVVRNEIQRTEEEEPLPLPPRREKQASSAEPREMSEKVLQSPGEEKIQSRPLPPPPAPPRTLKKKSSSVESSSPASPMMASCLTETEQFRTCAESVGTSRTLICSSTEEDVTLADSVVDSLVSCAETLVGDNDTLETCADTLTGTDEQTEFFSDDDNPYPSVDFDAMMKEGPGAGARIVESVRPGRSTVKKSESGRRLEEGTAQLSLELMEHVESLKTTLDNMSNRLGTRSRSRSHSKSRPASSSIFKDTQ